MPDGVLRPISKDYWEHARLKRPACFKIDDKEWQTELTGSLPEGYRYSGLRVSGSQIRSYWRQTSWWKRKLADRRGEVRCDYWGMPLDKDYHRINEAKVIADLKTAMLEQQRNDVNSVSLKDGTDEPNWPLPDALLWLWEHIRKIQKYESYVEHYEAKPTTMMRKIAQLAFNHAEPQIPLYGINPPRTVMDLIPSDHIDGWEFSDDASELFDKWWATDRRYINLRVRRIDIENRLKKMSE